MKLRFVMGIICSVLASFGISAAKASTITLQTGSFGTYALDAGGGTVFGNLVGSETSFLGDDGGSINLTPLFNLPAPFSDSKGSCPTILNSGTSCSLAGFALNTTVAGTFDYDLTLNFTYTTATGATEIVQGTMVLDATVTPLPAALPLFAAGLGALGLLGWRRKQTARSVAV
jgi:hypothetical protein